MNPFRYQLLLFKKTNSTTTKYIRHHEVGQISDEAQSRDGHHRAQERNPGERHHLRRGRGDEHPPEERQDDPQEQGPRQPGGPLHPREQHPILYSARVSASGKSAD